MVHVRCMFKQVEFLERSALVLIISDWQNSLNDNQKHGHILGMRYAAHTDIMI